MIILQSFNNPVWTISEVGGIYLFIILVAVVFVYLFFSSLREAILDVAKLVKRYLR